jgi:hypothetical protein
VHEPVGQRVSGDELHDQRADAGRSLDTVDRGDVRVIQGRERLGFTIESSKTIDVVRDGVC